MALEPKGIEQCREKASQIRNNAVFEVPHILEGILKINAGRHRRILSATNPAEAGLRNADIASRSSPNLALEAMRNRTDSLPHNLDTRPDEAALSNRFERALSVDVKSPAGAAGTASSVEPPTQSTLTSPESVRPPLVPAPAGTTAIFSVGDGPAPDNEGSDTSTPAPPMSVRSMSDRWKSGALAEGDSVSVNSSSYSDATAHFEEPLRLDEYDVPQMRLLINASGCVGCLGGVSRVSGFSGTTRRVANKSWFRWWWREWDAGDGATTSLASPSDSVRRD